MTFFYHGPLGMIYFIILSFVCACTIWRGSMEIRLFSYCILGVFLADRVLLWMFHIRKQVVGPLTNDEALMIGLGGAVEFIAVLVVILSYQSVMARVIAFWFAFKMAIYISLLAGAIEFQTMAAWTELVGYIQLAIIGLGGANVGMGKMADNWRGRFGIGRSGIFSQAGRVPPEGRSGHDL